MLLLQLIYQTSLYVIVAVIDVYVTVAVYLIIYPYMLVLQLILLNMPLYVLVS